MSGLLLVVLVTGLTWSRHAGDNFRAAQEAMGQASPKMPKTPRSQGASPAIAGAQRASLQALFETARAEIEKNGGSSVPLQLTPPKASDGLWRVDTLVGDRPGQRLTLALDGTTGHVLFRTGWDELPALAKATAVGIPLHRGESGVWNQVALALAALAAIFAVVLGVVMWWRRRPSGRVAAPAVTASQVRAVPRWLWVLALGLALAMPVFGISVVVFVALELGVAWQRRRSSSAAT